MNENDTIISPEQDAPKYMSVKIGALHALPLTHSFEPATAKLPSTLTRETKVETSTTSPSKAWIVNSLPPLPPYYKLERSSTYVQSSTPQQVADNISSCLCFQSIAIKVSGEKKNSIRAETSNGTKIAVHLFLSEDSGNDNNNNILVEVQRLSGCSFDFSEVSRSIRRSARGLRSLPRKRNLPIPSFIPKSSHADQQKRMKSGLEVAIRNLRSNRLDSQLIGLESLEKLSSDSDAAFMIVNGECLSRILECCESKSEESQNQIEGWNQCQMRRKALNILANGIVACQKNGCDIPTKLTEEDFIKRLLVCLEKSAHEPHEAYQAARCLTSLIPSSDTKLLNVLNDFDIMSFIPSPECRHLALEEEAEKLKKML